MLNPQVVRQQIENLKVLHLDLFEDEEAWLLSLESETDMNALLTLVSKIRVGKPTVRLTEIGERFSFR